MAKGVTISDVAEKAGVSTGTVSAVINGKPSVRKETREHVLSTIDILGYEPSRVAQDLGSGNSIEKTDTDTAGIIVKEIDNPFYSEVIRGARDRIEEEGYKLFIGTSKGEYEEEGDLLKTFRDRQLEGAVIAPVVHEHADLSHLFLLQRANFPFVLLEAVQGLVVDVVSIDNEEAGRRAVAHLLETGHERIIHFAGPPYTQHTRDRIRGVRTAFSESNSYFSDDIVVEAGPRMEGGYEAAKAVFEGKKYDDIPTGVTCFNDLVAIGVMRALAEIGLSVPDDVSVVGCDDIRPAEYLSTPLTTVHAPKYEMGKKAAEMLLRKLKPSADKQSDPRRVYLESELVLRESTAPRT